MDKNMDICYLLKIVTLTLYWFFDIGNFFIALLLVKMRNDINISKNSGFIPFIPD